MTSFYLSPYLNNIGYLHLLPEERSEESDMPGAPDVLSEEDEYLSLEGQTFHDLANFFPECKEMYKGQQQQSDSPNISNHFYVNEDS